MTHSGRVFGSEPPKKNDSVLKSKTDSLIKEKGKAVVKVNHEPPRKYFTNQEADEFLKIIKRSDYRVVDQLHQTPAKISILLLLINLDEHRDSLMKVLSSTHVAEEITVN